MTNSAFGTSKTLSKSSKHLLYVQFTSCVHEVTTFQLNPRVTILKKHQEELNWLSTYYNTHSPEQCHVNAKHDAVVT